MLRTIHLKLIHRIYFAIFLFISLCLIFIYNKHFLEENFTNSTQCNFTSSVDEFIFNYKSHVLVENKSDLTRIEPTIERIRNLLEIIRSKEDKYQLLLENFDVFSILNPMTSLKSYTNQSNIDEIKIIYNRYIKLMSDNKTIQINQAFIDYLTKISNYLSNGLKDKRMNTYQVECHHNPVFVLACNDRFFDKLQGAIHTLDRYWSDHKIIFYNMGITNDQEQLLKRKCKRCTIIEFPFSSIEKFAPHIRNLQNYGFKPFVIQDALRRYGTIIYGDTSARFHSNSFIPVITDNYIRGFAARELPGHYLSCFTRSNTFTWFNQSYTNFDNIYMAEANFLAITDTFLTRLIMKTWLICALEPDCLIADKSPTLCSRKSSLEHRYDQSAMGIILTYFYFQGKQSTWLGKPVNDPAPYDMFTSVKTNLGDINRNAPEKYYLLGKRD